MSPWGCRVMCGEAVREKRDEVGNRDKASGAVTMGRK